MSYYRTEQTAITEAYRRMNEDEGGDYMSDDRIHQQYEGWWMQYVGFENKPHRDSDEEYDMLLNGYIVWGGNDSGDFDEANTLTFLYDKRRGKNAFHQRYTEVWMPHDVYEQVTDVLYAIAEYLDRNGVYGKSLEFNSSEEFWKFYNEKVRGGVTEGADDDPRSVQMTGYLDDEFKRRNAEVAAKVRGATK